MHETQIGSFRLVVESRAHLPGGGPTLRVYDADGREVLRFDCFERGAHWHVDPDGRDERAHMEGGASDPVDWTLDQLRTDFPGLLAQAGVTELLPPEKVVAPALVELERALRA